MHKVPSLSASSPVPVFFPLLKKIIAVLMDVKWHLTVASICISLMAIDVETRFLRFTGSLHVFSGETSDQVLCLFLSWVVSFCF